MISLVDDLFFEQFQMSKHYEQELWNWKNKPKQSMLSSLSLPLFL